MKSVWAPLDDCTGHDVLVSFSQFDQMGYGLLHYACSPLVDVVLIVIITTQDSIHTLGDRTAQLTQMNQIRMDTHCKRNSFKTAPAEALTENTHLLNVCCALSLTLSVF